MAEEFTIKSTDIEDKINQLLPTQGGFAPGVDFSASTMVVPIVDLTETAEGSSLRLDLQSSLSHKTVTSFAVTGSSTTVLVNTTGYYRVFGACSSFGASVNSFDITDGTTAKQLIQFQGDTNGKSIESFDFIVKLEAGDSLRAITTTANGQLEGSTRQLADLSGNLTNP